MTGQCAVIAADASVGVGLHQRRLGVTGIRPVTGSKKEISTDRLLRTKTLFRQSVGISRVDHTDLIDIFVDTGGKINGRDYRGVML